MPPATSFGKKKWKNKSMDPSLSSSMVWAQPYPIVLEAPADLPSQTPKETCSSIDIDSFMNKLGYMTIVNTIIDRNRDTIMENILRDNVVTFDFGCPPPIDILDPTHPLFGWKTPSTMSSILHEPFSLLNKGYQPPHMETTNPNIPSTQVTTPIPQNTHPILTQPLVHTTSQPTPSVSSASTSTTHFLASQNPPFTSINTTFSLPPHNTSSPFTTQILSLGSNTSSSILSSITVNPFVTSQSTSASFPL